MQVITYLLYFFIYAFLGWCTEVSFATLKTGKFVNRGFLNGPVCSIYGFGMIFVLLLLTPIKNNLLLLFIGSLLVATTLEFVTGFVLEKFFHRKWWDYSKEPFNIKGYICLRFSILWGLCCLFVIAVIHPLIEKLVGIIPDVGKIIILILCGIYYLIDNIVTVLQIIKYNKIVQKLTLLTKTIKTEEVAKVLRISSDKIGENISDATIFVNKEINLLVNKIKNLRLVKAFPKLEFKVEKVKTKEEENKKNE